MDSSIYLPLIFEYTQEIILLFDENGKILEANKSAGKELGYDAGKLRGVKIREIFPVIAGCLEEGNTALITKQEIVSTNAYRKNKTCFAVDLQIVKIDEEAKIYIITAINAAERDGVRRELDKAKDESEQAVRTRNEFVANVTHELRTPLNGILGHVRNLLDEEDRPQQKKTLEIIERCCGDMNKIINNILDFSKLESGKFVLEEREFNLREMMEHVASTHIARVNEKGLQLKMMIDDNVPERIVGDELRLVQILNNLISNAIKFTPAGKVVVEVIQTLQLKDSIELFFLVIDSGIGIKEADKDKLFKSFSQVDASITRKYGGTGLGLAVCKELVELMHGTINVESEENKGSMFSFSVIVKLPEGEKVKESGKEQNIQTIKKNAMLLAEEDSADRLYQYGTPENQKELREELDKIILCMDMGSWEKAEMFAGNIKKLVQGAGEGIRRAAFRMEMATRKEDSEKAMAAYELVQECLTAKEGET